MWKFAEEEPFFFFLIVALLAVATCEMVVGVAKAIMQ